MTAEKKKPRVALFVTCLVDLFRPTVGFTAVKLIEDAGCTVEGAPSRTCCGQPAYNSGDKKDARAIAEQVIEAFEDYDFVVAPSGSCGGMLGKHYPELFAGDAKWEPRALAFSAKVHELVSFLTDVMFITTTGASHQGSVTYHDSCSGLRELGIKAQPRKKLLGSVEGLTLKELKKFRNLLRLRRHILRKISGYFQQNRLRKKPATSRLPARTCCWRVTLGA